MGAIGFMVVSALYTMLLVRLIYRLERTDLNSVQALPFTAKEWDSLITGRTPLTMLGLALLFTLILPSPSPTGAFIGTPGLLLLGAAGYFITDIQPGSTSLVRRAMDAIAALAGRLRPHGHTRPAPRPT
jgi:hypothetical protein